MAAEESVGGKERRGRKTKEETSGNDVRVATEY
jgi:hypothetical protein